MTDISIHALREEGDNFLLRTWHKADDFYPRPPRGGRQYIDAHLDDEVQFLSTPSARRATPKAVKASVTMSISIHALREEGDPERLH